MALCYIRWQAWWKLCITKTVAAVNQFTTSFFNDFLLSAAHIVAILDALDRLLHE